MPNPVQQHFVDWDKINAALKVKLAIDEQEQANQIQAMQWQGQQDYQTLTDSGVDPAEALRRAAPKLFFNNPVGLVRAVRSLQEKPQGKVVTIEGERFIDNAGRLIRIPKAPVDPTEFVDVITKDATGRTIRRKVPAAQQAAEEKAQGIADAQAAYNAAKSATGWFGMSRPDVAGMNAASNTLVNLGGQVPGQPVAPVAPIASAVSAPIPSPTTAPFPAGQPPRPNAKHIKYLMDNPGSAAQFNSKFGPGAAEELLQRRLPRGTIMGGSGIRG